MKKLFEILNNWTTLYFMTKEGIFVLFWLFGCVIAPNFFIKTPPDHGPFTEYSSCDCKKCQTIGLIAIIGLIVMYGLLFLLGSDLVTLTYLLLIAIVVEVVIESCWWIILVMIGAIVFTKISSSC